LPSIFRGSRKTMNTIADIFRDNSPHPCRGASKIPVFHPEKRNLNLPRAPKPLKQKRGRF
ncbi:hypothetical protein NDU88_001826, partial [Pleurodeles waltl]